MISTNDVQNLVGQGGIVADADGSKVGKIGQVYLDNKTGDPQWVTVSTGLFGTSESFVPLTSATTSGNDIQVPFSKSIIHDAPRVDADARDQRSSKKRTCSATTTCPTATPPPMYPTRTSPTRRR